MKRKPALALVNATAFVVSPCGSQALLIRPRKRPQAWELPGGKIDRRESLPSGACREVYEETGIRIELGALTAIYKCARQDNLMFFFLAHSRSGSLIPQPREVDEACWSPIDNLLEKIECPLHRQGVQDCLQFSGSPVYRLIRKRPFELFETVHLGLDSFGLSEIDSAIAPPSDPGIMSHFWRFLRP